MSTSLLRLLAALLALLFVVAACASETGARWTFAPVAVSDDGDGDAPVDQGGVGPPGQLGAELPGEEPEEGDTATVTEDVAGEVDPDLPSGEDPTTDSGPTEAPVANEAPPSEEAPPASGAPASQPAGEGATAAPDGEASGDARVIELQATADLRFKQSDQAVTDIPVTPGETVTFRVDNVAGFDHNFYIGTDEELSVPNGTTEVGIPTWQSGVQEVTWQVPEDVSGLKFGCTVPGHYAAGMQGTFSVAG